MGRGIKRSKFNPSQDSQKILCRYLSRGIRTYGLEQNTKIPGTGGGVRGQKDIVRANEHQKAKKSRNDYTTFRIPTLVFLLLEIF